MSQDSQFHLSATGKVEDFILDTTSAYNREFGTEKTKDDFSNSFVAIVAPSMEGKTQSAFSFKRIRPLYFPLTGTDPSLPSSQEIYTNFMRLSALLIRCAKKDAFELPLNVTAHDLKENRSRIPFWTLGFLKALVEKANSTELGAKHWLQYFAQQDGFTFEKCSTSELGENFFTGYCLFLDEFEDGWWKIFLRNLARVVGMICIVSNTNSKISALVGKSSSSGGQQTLHAWSLVVTKLNHTNFMILQHSHDDFALAASTILSSSMVTVAVKLRLESFFETEISELRPGIALFAADALVEFARQLSNRQTICNLGEFMLTICQFVLNRLKFRKPGLFASEQSFLAKFGMLYPQAYESVTANKLRSSDSVTNRNADIRKLSNQRTYIEDHLFYVSNPSSPLPMRKFFCTYPPVESVSRVKHLRVINEELSSLNNTFLIDWKHELTFLYSTEVLTILTCMLVFIPTSVTQLAEQYAELQHHPKATFNATNTEASSNSGNFLEACATAVICESSRFDHESKSFSFKGFDGLNLARNMIYHLLQEPLEEQLV